MPTKAEYKEQLGNALLWSSSGRMLLASDWWEYEQLQDALDVSLSMLDSMANMHAGLVAYIPDNAGCWTEEKE